MFIHATFIRKVDVFFNIFIQEINNIPLIFFSFGHIFTYNTVLETISRTIFSEKQTYTFIWRSHFTLNIILLHIDRKIMDIQTLWRMMCCNRWRNVEFIVFFLIYLVS